MYYYWSQYNSVVENICLKSRPPIQQMATNTSKGKYARIYKGTVLFGNILNFCLHYSANSNQGY